MVINHRDQLLNNKNTHQNILIPNPFSEKDDKGLMLLELDLDKGSLYMTAKNFEQLHNY